ncbi:MAG: 50S ribosomal protein L18 [Patescibacteria group bacterium]|jgi:large subunit ribosomal protein L18
MDKIKEKIQRQARRHDRVRAKVSGTAVRPRLSVFRSNRAMFLQLIDDFTGQTLVSAAAKEIKKTAGKIDLGKELGKLIAEKAKAKKITKVTFDRGAYKYHGRVKAVADGAREGGLEF